MVYSIENSQPLRFSDPTLKARCAQQTSFDMAADDMDPNNTQPAAPLPPGPMADFQPWYGEDGHLPPSKYDVGNIVHDRAKGEWRIELFYASNDKRPYAELIFGYTAFRVSFDEGVLIDEYRNSGIVVWDHNLFVATRSNFLDWLAQSSGGLYGGVGSESLDGTKHYAIITDDICIDILTVGAP